MNRLLLCLTGALFAFTATAEPMHNDDPLLTYLKIDKLEQTDIGDENHHALEAEGWVGYDINKLWVKTEQEFAESQTDEADIELLYSRAVAPFWDWQIGLRHHFEPVSRDWLAVGFKGLAPYFFETDVFMYAGDDGNLALKAELEYELLFTQKLILSPEIEANAYSKSDAGLEVGSGFSDIKTGLRLRYEITRQFAPYLGWEWKKKFGETADFAREEDAAVTDGKWVIGLRAWF